MQQTSSTDMRRTLRMYQEEVFPILRSTGCTFPNPLRSVWTTEHFMVSPPSPLCSIVIHDYVWQAPLTTSDTAILSGSLSTHNGNGGGNINLCVRRVTSARGWGEVRLIPTHLQVLWWSGSDVLLCVCLKLEFGAGDIRGPLFGMKVFRNVTARW